MMARRAFDWTRDPLRITLADAPAPPSILRAMAKDLVNDGITKQEIDAGFPFRWTPEEVWNLNRRIGRLETLTQKLMSQQKEKRRIKRMKKAVKRAKGEATSAHEANSSLTGRVGKPKKRRGVGRIVPHAASSRKARKRAR